MKKFVIMALLLMTVLVGTAFAIGGLPNPCTVHLYHDGVWENGYCDANGILHINGKKYELLEEGWYRFDPPLEEGEVDGYGFWPSGNYVHGYTDSPGVMHKPSEQGTFIAAPY